MMSQASSEFDDLDASGELESDVFGASDLSADDFGSDVGFDEVPDDDLLADEDLGDGGFGEFETPGTGGEFQQGAPIPVDSDAPAASPYRKQGFSIYTLMLILSFISLTATAIIMFTYASSL